ncbi:MAG: hypothetical protein ACYC3L_01320 [Gemmatimonadaceae bacterium]
MRTTQANRHADAVSFFYEHAGFSYESAKETESEGRHRCAQALAMAEEWGIDNDVTFEWAEDEWEGDTQLWYCQAWREGRSVASLGGIDLGDEQPYWYGVGLNGAPRVRSRPTYCRVVEAELAAEVMGDTF